MKRLPSKVFKPDADSADKKPSAETGQSLDIEHLRAEFEGLLNVKDRLARDYLLIRQAKASDIETSVYKEMFAAYKERRVRVVGKVIPLVKRAGTILSHLTIFSGLFLFVMEADNRREAAHNEAWRLLNDVKAVETSSAGRIGALQKLTKGCSGNFFTKISSRVEWMPTSEAMSDMPLVGGFFPDCVSLQGLDAQGAHLGSIKLPYANLKSARLQDAGLWKADLTYAKMTSVQLWRAEMSEVKLNNADLTNAEMRGVLLPKADLTEANLTKADLHCAPRKPERPDREPEQCTDLSDAILDSAVLSGANLEGANLERADLTGADLKGAKLDKAVLAEADLGSAEIAAAQLIGVNPPFLCKTKLPESIEINGDRDCDRLKTLED